MSKYLGWLVVAFLGVACGGTTDTGRGSGGGTSQGGSDAGSAGNGGGGAGGSAAGGAGTYDPRCPAHEPTGACSAAYTALTCQYGLSGCLCYSQAPGTFAFCQQVDPNCMYVPPDMAGGADTGGTAAAAAGSDSGAGGFPPKIALPPKLVCSCSGAMWVCSQGF